MSEIIEPVEVLYCEKCGMPPEYCEYSPDFESHCAPWLKENHAEVYMHLFAGNDDEDDEEEELTVEERLTAFYEHYMPEKLDSIPSILVKYEGKEEALFAALTKKYGPEPAVIKSEKSVCEGGDKIAKDLQNISLSDKKKRRGASAKKASATDTRIVIQMIKRTKRKAVTIIVGMDTVPGVKPNLKDVSQKFSRKFAGSSSVKGKEIIIQGDHRYEVGEFIVDEFNVSGESIFLDEGGEFVPFS